MVDPNIKKKADDIRTKIKGKEVRESLASGLEAMSSDVVETVGRQDEVEGQFQSVIENTTDKDVISAPEIIAARDGEANLKARLDKEQQEVTAQLAHNAQEVSTHKNDAQIHKPIYILDRLPSNPSNYADGGLLFVFDNLLSWSPSDWEKGSITGSTGDPVVAENRIRTVDFIEVVPSTSYLVYDATPFTIVSTTITIVEYDESDIFVKTSGWIADGTVITTAPNTVKAKVIMQNSESSADISVNDPQNISKPVISRLY